MLQKKTKVFTRCTCTLEQKPVICRIAHVLGIRPTDDHLLVCLLFSDIIVVCTVSIKQMSWFKKWLAQRLKRFIFVHISAIISFQIKLSNKPLAIEV